MKLNPKLSYFIENKLENNAENRYILFEETDLENAKHLILETATNEELKNDCMRTVNCEINGTYFIHVLPYKVISDVIDYLTYKKRNKGYQKIMKARDKYFPNWNELRIANRTARLVEKFNATKEDLEEYHQELFGEET